MFVYIFEILKREMMSNLPRARIAGWRWPRGRSRWWKSPWGWRTPRSRSVPFCILEHWTELLFKNLLFWSISIITILQIWPGISNYALTVVPAKGVVHCLIVASILVAKLGKFCQINILKNSIHLKLIEQKSHVLNQIFSSFKTFVLYLRCGLLVKHGLGGVETGIKLHIDAVQRRVKHLRLPAIVFNYSSNQNRFCSNWKFETWNLQN